jgi:ribonuclease HI
MYGHYDMASNNTIELRAAIEAPRILQENLWVLVSTDSNHIKRGITEWIKNLQRNGWKNSHGKKVPNVSLWKELLEAIARYDDVRWTWVSAHSGIFLNVCADMHVTQGVRAESHAAPFVVLVDNNNSISAVGPRAVDGCAMACRPVPAP